MLKRMFERKTFYASEGWINRLFANRLYADGNYGQRLIICVHALWAVVVHGVRGEAHLTYLDTKF